MASEERQVVSLYPIAVDVLSGGGTTTSTVACALPSTPCVEFFVRADGNNTGSIWIGPSTVASASGVRLSANQQVSIKANNTNVVYVYATSSTQLYGWLAEVITV